MSDDANTTGKAPATPEDKQAQMKRIVWILVIGILSLMVFYYLANGVTSLLTSSTAIDPAQLEQLQ